MQLVSASGITDVQVTKTYKFQPANFESKGVEVTLSHVELGLPDPTSVEESRKVVAELMKETELMLVLELTRQGRLPANIDTVREALRPWNSSG